MKIATWNVNSISVRAPLVARWTQIHSPDVICMQELKCVDEKYPYEFFKQLGYSSLVHGQKTYNGVGILVKNTLSHKLLHRTKFLDHQARLISAEVEGINIINIYVPNGEAVGSAKYEYKKIWLREFYNYTTREFSGHKDVLVCGDFNIAPQDRDVYDPRVWEGTVITHPPVRRWLNDFKALGFKDAFRQLHSSSGHYSWWDYRFQGFQKDRGVLIDHCLLSDTLSQRLKGAFIDRAPRAWEKPSDHAPLLVEIV